MNRLNTLTPLATKLFWQTFFCSIFLIGSKNVAPLKWTKKIISLSVIMLALLSFSNSRLFAQITDDSEITEIVEINVNQLKLNLLSAPEEFSPEAATQQTLINLPLPYGVQKTFSAQESPVMDKKLAVKYPEIKSYVLFDTEGGAISGRMSVTPKGVSYSIFTENGVAFLENFKDETENTAHKVYYGDLEGAEFGCSTIEEARFNQPVIADSRSNSISTGGTMRTYRIAIASSGEFTVGNGNTTAAVNAVFNEKINQLNTIFEKEVTMRFVLAAGNDNLIFFDAATDGLDPNNRTNSAQTVIDAIMPSSDFDIGHVFYEIPLCDGCMCNTNCASGNGVATINSVCNTTKARGWTGATSTASDDLFMGVFAHEVGHQFGARHSYYGTVSNCSNRVPGNGYEPGSGNSLMSYEGSCGSDNITPKVSTFYFHIHSISQILSHANGVGNCFASTATGNTPPVATAPSDVTIPQGTPFTITGAATDIDGDNLTYIWEQYDTDNSAGGPPNAAANSTTAPLFRSFDPSSDGNIRTFPQLSDILNNTQTQGEILPQVARTMHFRLTARDNNASGGGMHCDEVAITVDDSSVPFEVTLPTAASSYTANGSNMITVNWNVGATASTPISCSTVDIALSTDEGFSFPITLAAGTSNDGTESIVLPAGITNTSNAKIKVSCTNGGVQFFNLSDGVFTIVSSCNAQMSTLCATEVITAETGNAALNLSADKIFINEPLTSKTFTMGNTTGVSALGDSYGSNVCQSANFNHGFDVLEFTVDQTGTYTFTNTTGGFHLMSIFQASSYNPVDPCNNNGTFIGSTGSYTEYNGGCCGSQNSFTVSLTECTDYILVFFQASGAAYDVSFSGVGNIYESISQTGGTSYTYSAINTSTNQVAAVSSTADFTTLPGGGITYNVYGLSYDNAETPNSWTGLAQSALLDGTRCLLLSTNYSTLTVTGGASCPTASVLSGNATICNGASTNLSVAITGGVAPYTVVYNDGSNDITVNSYTSGDNIAVSPMIMTTYTLVSVTDANSCAGTGNSGSAIITVNSVPSLSLGTITNPTTCMGSDGSIQLTGLAATTTYTLNHKIDGAAQSAFATNSDGEYTLTGLSPAAYTEIKVALNGCLSNELSQTLTGTNCAGSEIDVKGLSVSIADGDTTPDELDDTDFGTVFGIFQLVTHTFTIENTGAADLTIGTIAVDDIDFVVTQAAASTVASGNSTTFTVRFYSQSFGQQTGIVSIVNNDADEDPYTFSVTGTAKANIESAQTGDWNVGSTWVGGVVPTIDDKAEINAGHTVTLSDTRSISAVLNYGILTTTNAGVLNIEGTENYMFENNATLNNSGTINIGATNPSGQYGIYNRLPNPAINNLTGGNINIDRTTSSAIWILNGTFTNDGTVTVGAHATSSSFSGISNGGTFINNVSGQIHLDYSPFHTEGTGSSFENYGTIAIGVNGGTSNSSLSTSNSSITNHIGGVITIENAGSQALNVSSVGTNEFNNHGMINIGQAGDGGNTGIITYVPFTNSAAILGMEI